MVREYVYVKILFYDKGQGIRHKPPNLSNYKYRPHFLVKGDNEYLGVQFLDGETVVLGKPVLATAQLVYEQVDYTPLVEGAEFFVVEGANKVGEGIVLKKYCV